MIPPGAPPADHRKAIANVLKLSTLFMASLLAANALGAFGANAAPGVQPNVKVGAPGVIAPVKPATLRNSLVRLSKRIPPWTVPPQPPLNMPGWTAVTHDGASFAPYLIRTVHGYGLLVRGSDNIWYGADFDISKPDLISTTAWNDLGLAGAQYCFQDPRETDEPYAVCSSIDGKTNTFTEIHADFQDRDVKSGAGIWYTGLFAAFPAAGTPAVLVNTNEITRPTYTSDVRFLAWDGATGLATAEIVPDRSKTVLSPWSKLAFWAYGRPACDGFGDCVGADGAGDKLSFYHVAMDGDGKPSGLVTLPPIPGGGGMRKGEYGIIWGGKLIDVLGRGKDGMLYVSVSKDAGATFGAWTSMGASVAEGAAPSCLMIDSAPTCAILAPDHRVYFHSTAKTSNGL